MEVFLTAKKENNKTKLGCVTVLCNNKLLQDSIFQQLLGRSSHMGDEYPENAGNQDRPRLKRIHTQNQNLAERNNSWMSVTRQLRADKNCQMKTKECRWLHRWQNLLTTYKILTTSCSRHDHSTAPQKKTTKPTEKKEGSWKKQKYLHTYYRAVVTRKKNKNEKSKR